MEVPQLCMVQQERCLSMEYCRAYPARAIRSSAEQGEHSPNNQTKLLAFTYTTQQQQQSNEHSPMHSNTNTDRRRRTLDTQEHGTAATSVNLLHDDAPLLRPESRLRARGRASRALSRVRAHARAPWGRDGRPLASSKASCPPPCRHATTDQD